MNKYALVICPISADEGGGYMAMYPDLPGCISDGETPEEATLNAQDAFSAWMEVQKERDAEIPRPGASLVIQAKREKDLLSAMRSLIDFSDHAEGRIAELEDALKLVLESFDTRWSTTSPLVAHAAASKSRQLIAKH